VPLHAPAGWNVEGDVQEKAVHMTPMLTWVQAPFVQKPVLPQAPLLTQRLCGSAALSTALQVPNPFRLQALQMPHDGEVQQTPSTQLPLVHSWPAAHPLPAGFFAAHEPFAPVQ
jgi:hypothetical protein